MKNYKAFWNLYSGGIFAFNIVCLVAFIAITRFVFTLSISTSSSTLEYVVVRIIFPMAFLVASVVWAYATFRAAVRAYSLELSESAFLWRTKGSLIPKKVSIPISDISGVTRFKVFRNCEDILLVGSFGERRLFAFLREADAIDIVETTLRRCQAEPDAAANGGDAGAARKRSMTRLRRS